MEGRDVERSARYVATVRPSQEAMKYVRSDGSGEAAGKVEAALPGEGEAAGRNDGDTGKGGAATSNAMTASAMPTRGTTSAVAATEASSVEASMITTMVVTQDGDEGGATMAAATPANDGDGGAKKPLSPVRRAAKKRRAARAALRIKARARVAEADRLAAVVRTARRLQHTEESRKALAKRRERRETQGANGTQSADKRAQVSLVQRPAATLVGGAESSGAVRSVEANDGLPTALMEVSGGSRRVKLDSGARYTVAGTDWTAWGDKSPELAPIDSVEGIGGFLLDVLGVWTFDMTNVFGQAVRVQACIVEGCTDEFLLGVDFLRQHRATMDFDKNEVRYDEDEKPVVIPFRTFDGGGTGKVAAVRMVRRMRLARSTVTPVEVSVAAEDGERGVFLPDATYGSVLLAATVTEARNGKAWVPAVNTGGSRVKLPSKRELGTWIPIDQDMKVLALNGETSREKIDEWLKELGDDVTPLEDETDVKIGTQDENGRTLVLRLLRAYRGVTGSKGACPPATKLDVRHHIDTGTAAPVMLKRRRQAQTEDAVTEQNVDTMLSAGVIEEGNGAWGFPVVLVRKKDGEVRFCVDYRALNKITKKDVYPLPRIDETLEALGGALLFTTLDLRAGYWQIRVAREDRDKTAFMTKRGLYRFKRMPFGLMNAPSTFQRMMNGVLRGLTWTTCLVYLDDIIVFTRGGIERHVVELASVLERLSTAGLTLKLKKCVFATQSMEYLGHELSCKGVRPVERLVTAVKEFPRPTDPVTVKRFVHLAGYYRKFVEAFGSIMAPLTRLLRKDVEWRWTEEQEFAFERVKMMLTTKPLLAYPNFELPFRLVTDASTVGLGACLMQDTGKGWQPIAYASKVNSSAEANYSITELECLAVVWAVKLFRPQLYGRAFTIVTDHAALKWLMTRTNPAGRLHRWALTLQEHDFEIVYRPGNTNVVADALSRAPVAVLAAVGRRNPQRVPDMPAGVASDGDKNHSKPQELVADIPEGRSTGPLTRASRRRAEEAARAADAAVGKAAGEDALRSTPTEPGVRPGVAKPRDETRQPGGDAEGGRRVVKKTASRAAPAPPTAVETRSRSSRRRDDQGAEVTEVPTLQITDSEISVAQDQSQLVKKLREAGSHQGMKVEQAFGLTLIHTSNGRRVVLPPALWAAVFKECHDSVWAGHLRAPHTYARIARLYWWPRMQQEVRRWVAGCQECGSRKVRPKEVIPPLRSLRGGDVGDRWALDVAGPFPVAEGGQRYVIAALEYVTRYAVATTVVQHTAENVADFLLGEVVLRFGPFRELLTDGAPELTGKAIDQLVQMLQARQTNPVPYRPQMIGLVERFHRTWKDCVSMYMAEEGQHDWELWVKFAVYAYNSARHSTVLLTPNELMMGRKLRAPGELLRRMAVTEAGDLKAYHDKLLKAMAASRECAERARVREQTRQAKYYNRQVRGRRPWQIGDQVWLYQPPRGPKATKFVHPWMGPLRVREAIGYENYLLRREDKTGKPEDVVAHASFLASYKSSAEWLERAAADLTVELADEDSGGLGFEVAETRAAVRTAAAPSRPAARTGAKRKRAAPPTRTRQWADGSNELVEVRRRRRRNKAGQYVLEFLLQSTDATTDAGEANQRWVSVAEYDDLFDAGKVVEDL